MRRLVVPILLGVTALAAAAAGGGSARAAGGPVTDGVWWLAQVDGGTLPYPPQVPAHGLWVSSSADGPTAVSAVHADVGASDTASGLTLHISNLTAVPATPLGPIQVPVLACPTTAPWTPVDTPTPGAWNARPTYDCEKSFVQGSLSGDNKTITFDLTSIAVPGKALDLALVPGVAPPPVAAPPLPVPLPVTPPSTPVSGNPPPTFDVTFTPPAAADVVIDSTAPEPDVTAAPSGSVSDVAPVVTGTPFVADTLGAPLETTAGVKRPLGPSVVDVGRTAPAAALATTSTGKRLLFGLVFAALMAWAWQQLAIDSRARLATASATGRRPRLTLYDVPAAPATRATARHFARSERTGRPPPLR